MKSSQNYPYKVSTLSMYTFPNLTWFEQKYGNLDRLSGCPVDALLIFMHEILLNYVLFKVFKPRSRQPTEDKQPKVKAIVCLCYVMLMLPESRQSQLYTDSVSYMATESIGSQDREIIGNLLKNN